MQQSPISFHRQDRSGLCVAALDNKTKTTLSISFHRQNRSGLCVAALDNKTKTTLSISFHRQDRSGLCVAALDNKINKNNSQHQFPQSEQVRSLCSHPRQHITTKSEALCSSHASVSTVRASQVFVQPP